MKRIFTFFLAFLMILSALPMASLQVYATESEETAPEHDLPVQTTEAPVPNVPAEETHSESVPPEKNAETPRIRASGFCGNNLTWVLTENKVLTISGTGRMDDFPENTDNIFRRHNSSIKEIVIEPGVTTIGKNAFAYCFYTTRITIPETITLIDAGAFGKPNDPQSIHITNLSAWCNIVFNSYPKVSHISSDQGCTLYLNGEQVENLVIPDDITKIPANAFCNFNFTSLTIPSGVTEIGDSAFKNCAITGISIPSSVNKIGASAFAQCADVKHIEFAGTAPTIGENAFEDIFSVAYYPNGDDSWKNTVSASYGGIIGWFPKGAAFVEGYMHSNNPGTTHDLYWKLENNVLYLDGDGSYWEYNLIPPWRGYRDLIHKLVMTGNIRSVPDRSFSGSQVLEEATITCAGSYLLSSCTALKRVIINAPIDVIYEGVFSGCSALEYVKIPDKTTYIRDYVFYNCSSLKTISIPPKIKRIYEHAFAGCTSLESVYFTGQIPSSFQNWDGIRNPFTGLDSVKIYYPAGNSSWSASRIKTFQNACKDVKITFTKYYTTSAPKLKATSQRYPILTWNAVSNANYYEIHRATSKSGKYTLVASVEELQWQDMEAAGGKTYYYKVKAIDTDNLALSSNYSSALSVAAKCDAPVISVENAASGKPSVSWEKVSGAKKYTVYRATSENGKYSKLGTTTKTYYTDSKSKAGYAYFYKVIANGSKSTYDSGYSNIVSCGVICGAPSVSVKVDANTGKPTLSWKKVDAATGYAIYRDGELLTTVTAVTYADTTAAIDTQYSYAVQALGKTEDLNGSLSKAVSATSGIAKPAAKGSVDTVSGKPVITWQAVEGAVKYEIYRSTKSSKSYKLVATVEELTYTDETVSAGKTYYYKVKAIGAVSKSADSSYVKLTGKCERPTIYADIDNPSGKPKISWEKVAGAKKYEVYRSTNGGSFKKLGTTTKLFYTDTKATIGVEYVYKVKAVGSKSSYNSEYSLAAGMTAVCGQPSVKASVDAVTGKPSLTWSKVSGAVRYDIYLVDADGSFGFYTSVTEAKFLDQAAQFGQSYSYRVVAIPADEYYYGSLSATVTVTATCAQPKATGKVGENNKPVISWEEVEGATNYVVYRSTSKSKGYKVIGEAQTLTYEDLTAKKGKTYYYKVVAVGEGFQSAQSSYVKVKSK